MKFIATALVMSLVLAGGAFAAASALVTSRQIKDRTIRVVDLNPTAVKALKARPLTVVTRDGDSRTIAAGRAAELTARCGLGEKAVSATWSGVWGNVRDLHVFENSVAAVVDNTRIAFDITVELRAVCIKS